MIEVHSFLLGIGALLTLTTFVFVFTTANRHNNRAGRLWSSALVAGAAALVLAGLTPWNRGGASSAVALGLLAAAFMLLWCGIRALGQRTSPAWTAVATGVLVGVVTALDQQSATHLEGLLLVSLVAGVASGLASRELRRGAAARNIHAQILQVVLATTAVAALLGIGVAVTLRASGARIDERLFGGVYLTCAAVLLIAVLCLSALRVELHGSWWTSDGHRPDLAWSLGVMAQTEFEMAARDRIERAQHFGGSAILILTEIQYLDEVNIAYGRAAGDESLLELGQILRTRVPASALIGHLGAGRFAVLSDSSVPIDAEAVIGAIARGLEETWTRPTSRLRISALFGTASSGMDQRDGNGGDLRSLIAAAETEMAPFTT